MNTKPIIFFAAALATAALAGCTRETTSSANIRTEGIAATIQAKATSANATALNVILQVGGTGGTYVVLDGGDKLTGTAGGKTLPLTATDAGEYTADFATGAAGTEFIVALDRAVDTDALNNKGTLPGPFEIAQVPTNTPSRAMDDVTITWSTAQAGTIMDITVGGSCVFSKTFQAAGDAGTFTIAKGTLESTNSSKPEQCSLDVTMSISAKGTVESVFDAESSFTLLQERKANFLSAP